MHYLLILLTLPLLFSGCGRAEVVPPPPQSIPSTLAPSSIVTAQPIRMPVSERSPSPSPRLVKRAPLPPSVALPSVYRSDDTRNPEAIDTIVLHSLYHPTASDPFAIASIKQVLDESGVSAHYVIVRDGTIYALVPPEYQAWHAGVSTMPAPDGRTGVNAFSIGIELVSDLTSGQTAAQLASLDSLVEGLATQYPIRTVVGHSQIAPGRKTDPWLFDWHSFASRHSARHPDLKIYTP